MDQRVSSPATLPVCGGRVAPALLALLLLIVSGCSRGSKPPAPGAEETATPAATTAGLIGGATASATASASAPLPGQPSLTSPSATAPAVAATPLTQQQLDQVALSVGDLPAGFAITASGPGGPELGSDVLTSFQEEFQQRDVTSTQSLQQAIVIINLLGQYRTPDDAVTGIRAITPQSLNQYLSGVNLTATSVTISPIGQESQAFHFTGSSNGVSIGGYLIAFHQGSIAAMILTAGVQGSESLDQTVALAQKQAQKLQSLT